MTGTKPWWQSRSVISGVVALLTAMLMLFDVQIGPEDQSDLTETLVQMAEIVAIFGAIIFRILGDRRLV